MTTAGKPLPVTHYELVGREYPDLVALAKKEAAKIGEVPFALNSDQIRALKADEGVITKLMVDYGRAGLKVKGIPSAYLSASEVVSMIPPEVAQRQFESFNWNFYQALNLEIFGKRTFFFSDNLSELLADTELSIRSEDFVLPFNACMFVYDSQLAKEALHALDDNKDPELKNGAVSVTLLMTHSEDQGRTLALFASHSTAPMFKGGHIRHHFKLLRQLRLSPGTTLEDALRTGWGAKELGWFGEIGDDSQFFGPGLRFIRMVVNSALYLTSASPEVSEMLHPKAPPSRDGLPRKQRDRTKIADGHKSRLPYIEVGATVPKYEDQPSADGEGHKLSYRFKVRSHWKTQRFGPGRSEVKHIQILPYWKGPDAADIIHRPYVVKGEPQVTAADDATPGGPRV